MQIEKEIRFYFSTDELKSLIQKLKEHYVYEYSYQETTTMYDNPNPDFTFYSKEVDGRLRVRHSRTVDAPLFGIGNSAEHTQSQCLVTWKRRLPETSYDIIRSEEEIEYTTSTEDSKAVVALFEDVLHCKRVSSYERIRNFLSIENVQITCDEFPYGIMLELELTGIQDEEILFEEIQKIGLDINAASKLSCDDMYAKLCQENNISVLSDILFADTTMPRL